MGSQDAGAKSTSIMMSPMVGSQKNQAAGEIKEKKKRGEPRQEKSPLEGSQSITEGEKALTPRTGRQKQAKRLKTPTVLPIGYEKL